FRRVLFRSPPSSAPTPPPARASKARPRRSPPPASTCERRGGVGGFSRHCALEACPPPRSPRVAALRCGERPSPPLRGGRVGARGAARDLSPRARLLHAIHACPIFDSQTGSLLEHCHRLGV